MKIISYILTPIFGLVFFLILLIFHPLQWIAFNIFGQNAHQKVVNVLNWFLVKSLLILGVPVRIKKLCTFPKEGNIIFVANHQSMFDIPPIIWHFRKYNPKFVSKIELGKGIPSVSYNLRHGGAALIDRKDRNQAIKALEEFAERINKNKWGAAIFPEGTRSRKGKLKPFATGGLKTILSYNPDAYIVPITVNNSWKIFKYGKFPLGIGSPITITTHQPIKTDALPFDELIDKVRASIKESLKD